MTRFKRIPVKVMSGAARERHLRGLFLSEQGRWDASWTQYRKAS
jgi:hypothetical protein